MPVVTATATTKHSAPRFSDTDGLMHSIHYITPRTREQELMYKIHNGVSREIALVALPSIPAMESEWEI